MKPPMGRARSYRYASMLAILILLSQSPVLANPQSTQTKSDSKNEAVSTDVRKLEAEKPLERELRGKEPPSEL